MVTRKAILLLFIFIWSSQLSSWWSSHAYLPRDTASFFKFSCVCSTVVAATCLQVVSEDDECLVERLGKYNRSLGPGLHFIGRPFEEVRYRGTRRDQIVKVPSQEYLAASAKITLDAYVYIKITNMKDAFYKVNNFKNAILDLSLAHLKKEIRNLTLEEITVERLNKALQKSLNLACNGWGIEVSKVETQHLQPSIDNKEILNLSPPPTATTTTNTTTTDTSQYAGIQKSEYEKEKLVKEAQARTQAMVIAEAKKQITSSYSTFT